MAFNHIFILFLLWNRVDGNFEKCSVAKVPLRLHFTCTGFKIIQVAEYLDNLNKDRNISTNGILSNPIQLTLERTTFPFSKRFLPTKRTTLMPNWLKGDVKLQHICIQNSNIYAISNQSFKSPQFSTLEVFEINNVPIQEIYTKSLSGLNNLKILALNNIQLSYAGLNILRPCEKLEVFTMHMCGPEKIWLYKFFGTSEYNHLQKIDIEFCDLDGTINYVTFRGLKALKELRLRYCNIKKIGPRSFDTILKTLTLLDLDSNQLASLPKAIFMNARKYSTIINLRNNLWHCDCELDDLKDFILANKFVMFYNVICKSPSNFKGAILISLPPLCEQSAVKIRPVKIVNDQLNRKATINLPKLSEADSRADSTIKPALIALNGTFNLEGDIVTNVTLTKSSDEPLFCTKRPKSIIETIQFSNDINLLESAPVQFNQGHNLIQRNGNASIKCSFTPNSIMLYSQKHLYRFSVIKMNSSMILLLDCSVLHLTVAENESDTWVLMDDKTLAICLCALFMFVAFAVGFSIPFGIAKFYRRKYRPFTSRVVDVTIPSRDNDDIVGSQGEIEAAKEMESIDASPRRRSSSKRWHRPALQMSMHQAVFENFNIECPTDDNIPPPLPPRNNLEPISS